MATSLPVITGNAIGGVQTMPPIQDLVIRRASLHDAADVHRILISAFAPFEEEYTRLAYAATVLSPAEIVERMAEGPIWVAASSNSTIGTASAVVSKKELYLRSVAVLPEFAGNGVARRMLKHVENFAARKECERIRLSTTRFLFAAHRLYCRCGYRQVDDESEDLFGTPLVGMEKGI